jgi:hypothetical protein
MVGYSGTPLITKLGIKAGQRAVFLNAPPEFGGLLGELPEGLQLLSSVTAPVDFVISFLMSGSGLHQTFASVKKAMSPAGVLWVSWPKKSSGVVTDLNENLIREAGIHAGLVDIKVCAVDETWSGLKFVIPVAARVTPRSATRKQKI